MTGRPLFVLGAGGLARRRLNLLLSQIPVPLGFRGYIGAADEVGRDLSLGDALSERRLAARLRYRGRPGGRSRQSGVAESMVGRTSARAIGRLSERRPSATQVDLGTPRSPGKCHTAGCTFTLDIRNRRLSITFNLHTRSATT